MSPIIAYAGDPTETQLESHLRRLGSDEIGDLLALLFIGRDEFTAADWDEAVRRADEVAAASDGVRLLLDSPHLATHLKQRCRTWDLSVKRTVWIPPPADRAVTSIPPAD